MTQKQNALLANSGVEFYCLFAAAMNVPESLVYRIVIPYSSWVDDRQRLNYVNIYAYTAPDEFFPKRPFLLRVAINKSAGRVTMLKQGQECQGFNGHGFRVNRITRGNLRFSSLIVSLVKADDKGSPSGTVTTSSI